MSHFEEIIRELRGVHQKISTIRDLLSSHEDGSLEKLSLHGAVSLLLREAKKYNEIKKVLERAGARAEQPNETLLVINSIIRSE